MNSRILRRDGRRETKGPREWQHIDTRVAQGCENCCQLVNYAQLWDLNAEADDPGATFDHPMDRHEQSEERRGRCPYR